MGRSVSFDEWDMAGDSGRRLRASDRGPKQPIELLRLFETENCETSLSETLIVQA